MASSTGDSGIYQIRVKGHFPQDWSDWFYGFEINNLPSGETVMTGEIVDQTALHSLLQRIRDIGLTLIEVKRLDDLHDNQ
jgi:hypothetical protein